MEPVIRPLLDPPGVQVATVAPDQKANQPPPDISVNVDELDGGIPGAEVVAQPRKIGFRSRISTRMSFTPLRLRPVRSCTLWRTRFMLRCDGHRCR